MDELVNEAVAEYVRRHAGQTEDDHHPMLNRIKACQESDPDFTAAIAAFAKAEAAYGKHEDPMEGRPASPVGPVAQKLRQLIDA